MMVRVRAIVRISFGRMLLGLALSLLPGLFLPSLRGEPRSMLSVPALIVSQAEYIAVSLETPPPLIH